MLKINNTSNQNLSELENTITDFFPYAQKRLKFDKPVVLNLVSDENNAKNVFGKTAYYQPDNHEITIFVDRRHPKDMLRSFSHELVHHAQNCRGEFDHNMTTEEGYAQNDSHMRKCEGEAYLLGNGFLVRDYEDHLKSKEINKMAINEDMIRKVIRESVNTVLEKYKKDSPDRCPSDTPADRLRPLEEEEDITEEAEEIEEAAWKDAGKKLDPDQKKDKEKKKRGKWEDIGEAQEELEEGEMPAGLKKYLDNKKGSADSDSENEEKGSEDSEDKKETNEDKTMNEAFFHPRHQRVFENLKDRWCK